MNSKDFRSIQMRVFICSKCGEKLVATKQRKKTGIGHVKHAYCYVCKETTEHIQIE